MHEGLYLRLRGVVRVVGIVVFTRQGGLYAGGVEEAAELLLLALSQAVDDATRLLLLLQGHTDICGQCVMLYCGLYMCFLELPLGTSSYLCDFCGETYRPDAFQAFLEPHAYGLLGNLFFNGVLQLFPGQQLLQLERLSNVH